MEEKKIQLSKEEYDYVKNEIENHILPGKLKQEIYEDKVTEGIMNLFFVDSKLSNFRNLEKDLKPFNLEEAKAGKPICTRDGRKVRIICFDAKRKDKKSIIALVPNKDHPGFEDLIAYPNNGNYYGGHENDGDLMIHSEKKVGWVNLYKSSVYSTKEEAIKYRNKCNDYIDTTKVTWED